MLVLFFVYMFVIVEHRDRVYGLDILLTLSKYYLLYTHKTGTYLLGATNEWKSLHFEHSEEKKSADKKHIIGNIKRESIQRIGMLRTHNNALRYLPTQSDYTQSAVSFSKNEPSANRKKSILFRISPI